MSVAMHLSGLDAQHFTGDHKLRWLYEDGARKLQTASPALSTTSTTSSSGFNSWGSDIAPVREDVTLVNYAPQKTEGKSKITYKGRNLLDLVDNMTDSRWDLQYSKLPKDPLNFFNNRSQYSRVNGDDLPLHIDVACEHCNFVQSYFD